MDEIQQLIEINDRKSAFQYLENANKRAMHQIACRLVYKGVEDNAFIAQITSCPVAEIEELRTSLTFEEAMVELGLSEKILRRYIRRGLIMHDDKIPRYAVGLMKDPVYGFLMQWEYQQHKLENQTREERLENIRERIAEFEEDYGGRFEELFGHLSYKDIDFLDDSTDTDVMIWKELIEELRELERRKGEINR
ncbi:hypothetical protein P4H94_07380 [Paenibacillus macerans]|uniref:Uncharacterized protein n=1 Tax=Paenibacillus macerans TaxID=44252 RepID=A0A6N8EQJ4_PAEMA|nr:hypothetical protein [Paenibacillus macerans]MEC0136706.1 hypothetical protein [Paenibacillus macerans]MED4955981.1 hypothetical protein [Paenibacillus macerans]MUG21804.1 hypothetical protein [Paenibacillus macerans]